MYRVTLYDNPYETNGIVIHNPNVNGEKVEGSIKDEINKIDTFTFGMTIENKGYGKIKPFQSFITVLNTKNNKKEFKGRVYGPNESMDETGMLDVSYTCEGEVSYLTDSQQRHLEFRGTSSEGFKAMLDYHNTQVEDYKRFEMGVVEVHDPNDYMYFYLSAEKNTWDSIFEKLINKLGGELKIRYENGVRYLDWLERIGHDSETEIRLAKNLMSVNRTVDPSEIVTRLTPLGNRIESEDETATDASEARLTIESVNNGKPYIDRPDLIALFGIIGGSETWDGVTTPQRLLTNGISWLDNQKVVLSQHQIGALDLASIGLDIDFFEKGNTHHVKNPIMVIDERLRIIGTQKDINEPENSSLVVGDKFLTGTEYQVRAMQSSERVAELQGRLDIQSSQMVQLRSAYAAINSEIEQVQTDLLTIDIDNLPVEIQGLHNQLEAIQTSINKLPTYSVATPSEDGLMASGDKAKIDRLSVNGLVDLDTLKAQVEAIDLSDINTAISDLTTRVEALEEPEGVE